MIPFEEGIILMDPDVHRVPEKCNELCSGFDAAWRHKKIWRHFTGIRSGDFMACITVVHSEPVVTS
jgi:hypothetical protein